MRDEMLKARGLLAQLLGQREEEELKIKGLIILIRNYADPFEHDLSRLKTKELSQAAADIHKCTAKYNEFTKRIEELRDGLQ